MIRYGSQHITDEDVEAVSDVLRSEYLTQGPVTKQFEMQVASYCGVQHSCSFNNATSALHASCLSLGLTENDWLWTSSNSFVASANCGLYCGAKVDFVDIDPKTYNICVNALTAKLEDASAKGTLPKIVVVVHFAGLSCDMLEIRSLSKKYGFYIIEDASHAVGALYHGDKVGSCAFSDITVFSFHPVKIITTGEGGIATTNSADLIKKIRLFQSHGITRGEENFKNKSHGPWYYEQQTLGHNYRMTDIQCALGISQLARLDQYIKYRNELADYYDYKLACSQFTIPYRSDDRVSACHLYVIKVPAGERHLRRKLVEQLLENQIGVNVHYIPIHQQPFFQEMKTSFGGLSETEDYYSRALTLPLHANLTLRDLDQIICKLTRLWNGLR